MSESEVGMLTLSHSFGTIHHVHIVCVYHCLRPEHCDLSCTDPSCAIFLTGDGASGMDVDAAPSSQHAAGGSEQDLEQGSGLPDDNQPSLSSAAHSGVRDE